MKIQKVFTKIGGGGEKLYSLLLTEDELALFSNFDYEDDHGLSKGAKVGLGVAGATAATGLGIYGADRLGDKLHTSAVKKVINKTGVKNVTVGNVEKVLRNDPKLFKQVERRVNIGNYLKKPANFIRKIVRR